VVFSCGDVVFSCASAKVVIVVIVKIQKTNFIGGSYAR
jgi:hypothetical protein